MPELVGAWWLLPIAIVLCLFNYLLGEELLFRGILLPRMRGVFGWWDWAANAVLFALYHLHKPTQMLDLFWAEWPGPYQCGIFEACGLASFCTGSKTFF